MRFNGLDRIPSWIASIVGNDDFGHLIHWSWTMVVTSTFPPRVHIPAKIEGGYNSRLTAEGRIRNLPKCSSVSFKTPTPWWYQDQQALILNSSSRALEAEVFFWKSWRVFLQALYNSFPALAQMRILNVFLWSLGLIISFTVSMHSSEQHSLF